MTRIPENQFIIILFFLLITLPMMSQEQVHSDIKVQCDPETGLCTIPDFDGDSSPTSWQKGTEIIYIGDPMCSWCWGISPELNALGRFADAERIPFTIVMGGLRPGGGEAWDADFKRYLKHHWHEVNQRSGQPFGYALFDQDSFDYDTEPACRAVITARTIAPQKAMPFYELTQHHFYVQSQDPKEVSFYQPICDRLSIDYDHFAELFLSDQMKQATAQDFARSRQWGVRAFPSVVFRKDDQLYLIAQGYAKYEELKKRILDTNVK